ncbi:MAG: hypothetical protein AAGL89_00105 [Pseudomonadota bacterium]
MKTKDTVFEEIRALSDDAEELGLTDVALVLEFALDVYLKETGALRDPSSVDAHSSLGAAEELNRSAVRLKIRSEERAAELPRLSYTMSLFPLADVSRKAS